MKKIYTVLFLYLISIARLDAQQMDGLAAFVKSGVYSLSSSLNEIAPPGFNLPYTTFASLGGEGYYRNNKTLFILDGNIGLENSKIIASRGVKLYSQTIFAKAGWIIKEKKHYWIYPTIGIGIASLNMNTCNKKNDFADNLQSHLIDNALVDLGINADFIFKKIANPQGQSMISGLRAGCRLSVKNKAWRGFDGNKLDNLPYYAQNGFYISLAIGYGIFIKN